MTKKRHKRSVLARQYGLSNLKGIKKPERDRMHAIADSNPGCSPRMLTGMHAEGIRHACLRADYREHRTRMLGKLGGASEVRTLDPNSPEFLAIASKYADKSLTGDQDLGGRKSSKNGRKSSARKGACNDPQYPDGPTCSSCGKNPRLGSLSRCKACLRADAGSRPGEDGSAMTTDLFTVSNVLEQVQVIVKEDGAMTNTEPVTKRKSWRDVLPIHPAAELLPLMSSDELRELADDIKNRLQLKA